MFRKKLDTEILNLFNKLENKIDTINSNFGCITFLDGCCKCKERDVKINEMLITFLESKFSDLFKNELFKNKIDSILTQLKTELKNTLISKEDYKSSFTSIIESITEPITNEIKEFKQNSANESINLKNEIQQLKQNQKFDLLIEENIKKIKIYSETIDSLKISIEKSINDIDNKLCDLNFLI